MAERYPGYDVLRKWHSPSWNDKTREVVKQRLAIDPDRPQFLDAQDWTILRAICDRIVPQPADRLKPVPVAAMVDRKLAENKGGGYRDSRLPPLREAWKRALSAFEEEAMVRYNRVFSLLSANDQDELLGSVQRGDIKATAWGDMPPALFFSTHLLHDIVAAYYTHPTAWNEIGFGGPASPRGYVRMGFDSRDPWEAAEAALGGDVETERRNGRIK